MRPVVDEDLRMIQESVARISEREISRDLDALNHYPDMGDPSGMIAAMRELGLFELASATGEDSSFRTLGIILETLAETAAAPAALLLAHSVASWVARETGFQDSGGLQGCAIYTEAGHTDGNIVLSKRPEGYTLNGTCRFVVNAGIADSLLLLACSEENPSEHFLVLVDASSEGLRTGKPLLTLGMRGCPVADIEFRDVKISPQGCVPGGIEMLHQTWRRFRGPVAAIAAGITGASLRTATGYAQERYQGGKQIIDHQQVRAMLAEMLADYQACCEAADRLSENSLPVESIAASLFIRAKESAARATTDGVQLLGGYGYMEDYGQERRMRDAKQAQCLLGRCDILRQQQLAGWLASEAAL